MIETTAKVIAVEGDEIVLEAQVQSACGGCAVKQGCGTSVLAKTVGRKFSQFRVMNTVQADVGDSVVLGLPENTLVLGSFLVYLLPLLGMIMAALAADSLLADVGNRDGLVAVAGFGGLVLSIWMCRDMLSNTDTKAGFQPVVLRKVS